MGTKSPERNVSDCSYTCTTFGDAAGLETSSRRLKGEVCGLSLLNQRTDSAAYVVRYVILDTLFQFIHVWGERRRVNGPEVSASDTPATIVPTIHFTYTNIQANKCTLAEAWHFAVALHIRQYGQRSSEPQQDRATLPCTSVSQCRVCKECRTDARRDRSEAVWEPCQSPNVYRASITDVD